MNGTNNIRAHLNAAGKRWGVIGLTQDADVIENAVARLVALGATPQSITTVTVSGYTAYAAIDKVLSERKGPEAGLDGVVCCDRAVDIASYVDEIVEISDLVKKL